MTSTHSNHDPHRDVIEWLLDSDPSIRWQVMRDLLDESPDAVAAERALVGRQGWGARLLELQKPDGSWGKGTWTYQDWTSTFETLGLLRELGLDPQSPEARRAIDMVKVGCTWQISGGQSPFFEGETEPCINGRVLAIGAYFGVLSLPLLSRLLDEQLPDGGWNCDAPTSNRSSFNSTICVLEGLLECEPMTNGSDRFRVKNARLQAQRYLWRRGLMRSLSTGEVIERDLKSGCSWLEFSFPAHWNYDVLRGLDYVRSAESGPLRQMASALDLVESKRGPNGRWLLDHVHVGNVHFAMEDGAGTDSRWITLRAMRVPRFYDR